jgi:hypothetical protein
MAHGQTAYDSHNVSTDNALVDITVRLNTAKWSKRKKNIVTEMITTGILNKGLKTVCTTADIMKSYNIPYKSRRGWGDGLCHDVEKATIRPEMLSDLEAVIVAGIKIRRANNQQITYTEDVWERNKTNSTYGSWLENIIPVRKDFPLDDYMHEDTPESLAAKEALCKQIVDGGIITATYTPEQEAA